MVGPLDPIFPCAGSLCQVWSWSLFFAQRATERLALGVPLLSEASLVNDRGPPVVIRIRNCEEPRQFVYAYVDNLGVLGTIKRTVEQAMASLQVRFGELNLALQASEVNSGSVEALGYLVDCSRFRSNITPSRLRKLHQALCGLLRRVRCMGGALEVVVGHLTLVGLIPLTASSRPATRKCQCCGRASLQSYEFSRASSLCSLRTG